MTRLNVFGLLFLLFSKLGYSNAIDNRLTVKSANTQLIAQGQVLFEQVCASCHAKDLSGASGFNLKDGEWIHGDTPSQILQNVKTGFRNAGMPGFGDVFAEEQLESIVAYVMSKREGWDNLTYSLYQLKDPNDKVVNTSKLIKSGKLKGGLADFAIPEIQDYVIEFEGDFYAPNALDTQIWLEWGFPHDVLMYVDHELVPRGGTPWFPTWRLKRGKQHLKIRYHSGTTKPNQRNLVLIGTNLDMTIKLFAVSSRAKGILEGKKFDVKADHKTRILRKRINQLPPSTIAVGLPLKLNYGFNTKSCAIVGLWQGDLLNIGPNIAGRGEDPSLPLGQMVFHSPQQMSHQTDGGRCVYQGYQLKNGEPVFAYQINKVSYLLAVAARSNDEITFTYTADTKSTSLILPESNKLIWSALGQQLAPGTANLVHDKNAQFVLTATITK